MFQSIKSSMDDRIEVFQELNNEQVEKRQQQLAAELEKVRREQVGNLLFFYVCQG